MLKTISNALCSLALAALAASAVAGKGEPWITNMEEAQKIAKAEGKDIFMFFTGSDWCGLCIRLEDEVLNQSAFLKYAKDNLVLVDLDYPHNQKLLTQEQKDHNEQWIERFPVQGFPTIYITDAKAKRYAVTGYQGVSPEEYVESLKILKANKSVMEKTLNKASKASGLTRAKLLDEVLSLEGTFVENSDALMYEVIKLSRADRALNQKYINIKDNKDLMRDLRSGTRATSAEEDLERLLALFNKYRRLKEGQSLELLLNHLEHGYLRTNKIEEGIAFMGKLQNDSSYLAGPRQTSGILKALMEARQGDLETAAATLENAMALSPESEAAQQHEQILQHLESIADSNR